MRHSSIIRTVCVCALCAVTAKVVYYHSLEAHPAHSHLHGTPRNPFQQTVSTHETQNFKHQNVATVFNPSLSDDDPSGASVLAGRALVSSHRNAVSGYLLSLILFSSRHVSTVYSTKINLFRHLVEHSQTSKHAIPSSASVKSVLYIRT